MSHITKTGFSILRTDLDAAEQACRDLGGLELKRDQHTYKWFGQFMNDSESGRRYARQVSPEKWGRCAHAIVLTGQPDAYEIGLVENSDGNYDLVFDSWGPGAALVQKCGEELYKLKQAITACICEREMVREDYRSFRTVNAEGNVVIEFEK